MPTAVLCAAGVAQAADLPVGATQVGGKVFVDATHIDRTTAAGRSDGSGYGVDLTRFYLNVDHRFSDVWSAHLLTDLQWPRHDDPTDLWVKHAYLQGDFSKAFVLRLGAAATPWIGLVNQWYGYRYVEKDLIMRAKVGSTADWGVHALGALGSGRGDVDYAVSVITGAGYKKPRLGNGPDVGARVSWQPSAHTVVGVGGYHGTLGRDVDGREALHTARRWDVMAAYADERWRLGGQYFHADDWNRVLDPAGDTSHGWSVWASMQVTPRVSVFARHDHLKPSVSLDPERHDRYSNAGVEWQAGKGLRLAAVYKRERLRMGSASFETTNEVGVWAQVTF